MTEVLKAKGRTLAEFEKDLSPAEKTVLAAARDGEVAWLGDKRPETASDECRLRAGFVRFLALGGDETTPVHEKGVQIAGGWIDGDMDCEGAVLPHDLILWDCRLDGDLILRGATTRTLNLGGTRLKGIEADRLEATGGVYLRNGFHATSEVRLLGARIGANLECDGGRFENPEGVALHCDRIETKGGVFLRKGFYASGEVRLTGARIGGNLECNGGRFDNPEGVALYCDGATIAGALFLREGAHLDGRLDLSAAKIGSLVDDAACWPKEIVLDGFRYDRFTGAVPFEAAARLRWLNRQPPSHRGEDFKPQPWEHLIKVLREMGHFDAARDIAIEKQNRLRRLGKIRTPLARGLHWLFGALAGYGYRPLRPVRIAFGVWLVFAFFYHLMAGQGVFGPSNPLVFDNPKYAHCRPDAPDVSATGKPRVGNWVWCPDSPGEYAAFSPMAYSLDLILPVISLGQANEWGPITPASAPDKRELQRFGNLMFDILKIGDPRTWEWLQNPDDPAKCREFLGLLTRFVVSFEILVGWACRLAAPCASAHVRRVPSSRSLLLADEHDFMSGRTSPCGLAKELSRKETMMPRGPASTLSILAGGTAP
jgi:hypothetical protein